MSQMLLFPDPRPLVERLGAAFFREAPECAGVYLMRDAGDAVLYVGKARNLRKRLSSYRVANPDRMPRRHLRLLRAVARIELQECTDEPTALATESKLLRSLRPRFNRAGTWPGTPRFLLWQVGVHGLQLQVSVQPHAEWTCVGPLGGAAEAMRAALSRLLWSSINLERSLSEMPLAWFRGRHSGVTYLSIPEPAALGLMELGPWLHSLFDGDPNALINWVESRTAVRTNPFEAATLQGDLDTVREFAARQRQPKKNQPPPPANTMQTTRGETTPGLF